MLHRFVTIQKFAAGGAPLPDRIIIATASDETVDRAGDVMVAAGGDVSVYRANPIVLRDHDPTKPVGTASVITKVGRIEAAIKFAPKGVSETADETYALVKASVLNGVSIGFRAIKSEPRAGHDGVKYTNWELLELSIVAVPANPGALILQRSYRGHVDSASGKVWASGISAAEPGTSRRGLEVPQGDGRVPHLDARHQRQGGPSCTTICATASPNSTGTGGRRSST
jgi:HK97 family phage prohead protease